MNNKIMVVDDETMVANLFKEILTLHEFEVEVFTSSLKAYEAFIGQPDEYGLVISDYTMPDMTGGELAAKILERRADIPVVICTGYSDYMDKEKAEAMGVSAFLNKPIRQDELLNIIRSLLTG